MDKHGYYLVNDKKFYTKGQAVYEGATSGKPVKWNFNDTIFTKYLDTNLNNLGNVSLDTLYRIRAQQLRDTYDYLILNYSGGADSHNILMTFLNNNIKLDEVYVKYSNSVDSKLYTPTTANRKAENIHSEWDFVIKPVLDELAIRHPGIKIVIEDVFTNIDEVQDETILNAGNFIGPFELLRQRKRSPSIDAMLSKGKRVADIFGIDKPSVILKDGKFVTFFADNTVNVAGTLDDSTELFYWTPDLPEIAFEQAYKHYQYFKANPDLIDKIDLSKISKNDPNRFEFMRRVAIDLIYTTWDHSKFQVTKPENFSIYGRSRDRYYIQHAEFERYLQQWRWHSQSWESTMTASVFQPGPMQHMMYYSKGYILGEI